MDYFIGSSGFWLALAAVALIAEIFTLSFFFFFLSLGAAFTALLTWVGITPSMSTQGLSFAAISLGSMLLFRNYALSLFQRNKSEGYEAFTGDSATVSVEIPPRGEGKILYRGSEWIAFSNELHAIPAGDSVVIEKIVGIKALVKHR